ncbi:MAG: NAD-dependent deacylase, partial [candidate division NC10 bacterium]|nr:NAD-dependent deacylase [candidate division NC10 bacterium]
MSQRGASELQGRLRRARRVAVLTGAGVSAESGVPTFRGTDGLWRQYRAEDLATPEAFQRDPRLVWEWYDWRRQLIAKCQPNPAHHAIAALERDAPEFLLITQNVDGLHRKAGSVRLVELHGNLWRVRCM